MGSSHTAVCDGLVRDIWVFAISQNIWLSASHIPGKQTTKADKDSRHLDSHTEWKLAPSIFNEIILHFQVTPEIDLFASHFNYQLKPFVSHQPDPEAYINACQLSWQHIFFYAFPLSA